MNHLYAPKIIATSIRLLPKYKRKFISLKFDTLESTLLHGLKHYKNGFRVYKQNCYEWHDPLNILLAKIEKIRE